MDFMFDWEAEGDRFSFEDSDRFEEDSLCSWISEPESLCNNWRGWRRNGGQPHPFNFMFAAAKDDSQIASLVEIASKAVACHIPFEVVEHFYPPIPEQLQLRIAFWSFPENEEDIRLYSCLANGSAEEFQKGDHLFKAKAVKDPLQIGFHLSATVIPPQTVAQTKGSFNVAVMFDRRRITSCNCTCNATSWCAHVVALCLFRIHQAPQVCLRAPVSESLSRLHRDQLQKFAQYLISELPQQILPTAQRLLDELLSSQQTAINTVCGAPDPTAGPSASEQTSWCLDESTLHENIKKTLIKFCVPSPIVFSDVNYLSSTAPPAAAEWQNLLRPLRGREPEGMWNLLSIVREMFKRHDSNAMQLLEILTEEVLACDQILIWWFNTKVTASNGSGHGIRGGQNSTSSSQHAASSLCDEIVGLWRLCALDPAFSPIQRDDLLTQFKDWHILTIDKVRKARSNTVSGGNNAIKKVDIENFSGFKSAMEACQLDWEDYVIHGITYIEKHRPYSRYYHMGLSRHSGMGDGDNRKASARTKAGQVSSTQLGQGLAKAITAATTPHNRRQPPLGESRLHEASAAAEVVHSSSSEGFCESDRRDSLVKMDSDSDTDHPVFVADGASNDNKLGGRPVNADAQLGQVLANAQPMAAKEAGEGGAEGVAPLPDGEAGEQAEQPERQVDEYQVYFYNTKAKLSFDSDKKKKDEANYFAGIKKFDTPQDILFARAEALHAHGHTREACRLARKLAEEMLTNPPDLTAPPETLTTQLKGKKKKGHNGVSSYASCMLAKAAFLCSVLLEEADCHHWAFRVGMYGLEMPRPPASSKALEVKIFYQESELMTLLKRIPLGVEEMSIIRDRAEKLRDGKLKTRGEAFLPITLASFIFDSLCLSMAPAAAASSRAMLHGAIVRTEADEKLGFDAAVAALGLKANVSEADHPLLCEGTRRQRGELAVTLLVTYKDDQHKLSKIMDKLLDKDMHQLYKAPSVAAYLPIASTNATLHGTTRPAPLSSPQPHPTSASLPTPLRVQQPPCQAPRASGVGVVCDEQCIPRAGLVAGSQQVPCSVSGSAASDWQGSAGAEGGSHALDYLNLEDKFAGINLGTIAGSPTKTTLNNYPSKEDSVVEEESDCPTDYKAWEVKFRCTNLKTTKKHSVGMASVDSSAPETTSSDNSPTLIRRNWPKHHHQGPGSDSGSSGKSTDSLSSSVTGSKPKEFKETSRPDDESPTGPFDSRYTPQLVLYSRSSTPSLKAVRYKGKNRMMPTVPNQPSEASAHFMFELAKTVLNKAGGNSSTSLFTQPPSSTANQAPSGPHRALHLCAFQIGLYALGLHNCVSPNWLSRTYSSHVSWITGQAMEIGSAAINILIETWEGHLTPQEVASLADRASRGRDPNMVKAAAELALSCLPHAQALNPNEIQRALIQCKEQSREMLERACLAVESAAKGGGVYPEVLFDVAKRWYELYEESMPGGSSGGSSVAAATVAQVLVGQAGGEAEIALIPANIQLLGESNSPPVVQLVPAPQMPVPNNHPNIPTSVVAQGAVPGPAALAQAQIPPGAMGVGPIPYTIAPPSGTHSQLAHHPYIAPYSYVQQVPPNFAHHYSAPHIQLHTHNMHPSYMSTYPYQSQSGPTIPTTVFSALPAHPHSNTTLYHANVSHLRPPPLNSAVVQAVAYAPGAQLSQPHPQTATLLPMQQSFNQQVLDPSQPVAMVAMQQIPQQSVAPPPQQPGPAHATSAPPPPEPILPSQNSAPWNYLLHVYRVGMLAMETLARRVHDDRPQTKYARNPPYGEDVKWLLSVAMKLGTNYLQQFCASAVNAIVSPFVLQDIAIEAAHCLARSNPNQASQHLRSPMLNSLLQKCLQMFIQCTHQRIHHISPTEYDEFVGIVCSARNAFCMTPGGMVQFHEMLQGLRRTKSCKKDLWQRILNALHTGNI